MNIAGILCIVGVVAVVLIMGKLTNNGDKK